ncbi:MAG: sigma-70 family RNA polymerase sigma factor, partial [Sedimentisphaerales bacterium]|nr:sigma-70 family RNA polymerase sigma factor [Sedimentisphaerales bacterium]
MQVIDWKIIIEEHGPVVWQTAYRLLGNDADAADCFQETFAGALKLSRRQRVKNFPALLIRLATTRAIDQLRRRFRRERISNGDYDLPEGPNKNPDPAQHVQQKELAGELRKALMQLSSQEAQVFCMRHLNDMSYRQIANELGIKTSATGVMLHRAKTKLRQFLEVSAKER